MNNEQQEKEYGWDEFKYGTMACSACGRLEPGSVPESQAHMMGHAPECSRKHLTYYSGKEEESNE